MIAQRRLAARFTVVLAMILSFAVLPGPAQATTVHCGDTITQDTTLDSDLSCGTFAFSITGSNLTVDLAGHTVEGQISIADSQNAALENGTVEGRVAIGHSDGIDVRNNTLQPGAADPAISFGKSGGTVSGNIIQGGAQGILIQHSGAITITDNSITGARFTGVGGDFSGGIIFVMDNLIAQNGTGVGMSFAQAQIVGNRIIDNRGDGVNFATKGHQSTVIGNVIDHNGADGIRLEQGGQVVNDNHVWWNGGWGIESVPDATGTRNWAKHNALGQCSGPVQCSTTGKPKG